MAEPMNIEEGARLTSEIEKVLDKWLGCADEKGIYRKCKLSAPDKRQLIQQLKEVAIPLIEKREREKIFNLLEESWAFDTAHRHPVYSCHLKAWQALKKLLCGSCPRCGVTGTFKERTDTGLLLDFNRKWMECSRCGYKRE